MTSKKNFNAIVRSALTINRHLETIRNECKVLIDQIHEHADDYDLADYEFELALLDETLTDLACFDLEDSIPEKHDR